MSADEETALRSEDAAENEKIDREGGKREEGRKDESSNSRPGGE